MASSVINRSTDTQKTVHDLFTTTKLVSGQGFEV